MKTKIAIYGGTNLSADAIAFVARLTRSILKLEGTVIISGGFDHYTRYPERKSVDKIVMETAIKYLAPEELSKRFETWLPKENDRSKVIRFEIGNIVKLAGSTQARRFHIVQHADAVITIKGEGHTRSVIELALAIDKPVLPIPFTGGDSKKMWDMYKEDIIQLLRLSPEINTKLQQFPATHHELRDVAKSLALFIKDAVQKKCLVLMPFGERHTAFYDNFLKPAINESDYVEHRIDRNDAAGNIPSLFKSHLEGSRAVIVDITELNPNVLYELGYAHANDISPLIIYRGADVNTIDKNLPFYLKQEMIIRAFDNIEGYKIIREAITRFLKSGSLK